MAWYYVRNDAMGQATAAFSVVETGADGSTAGPVKVPVGASLLRSMRVSVVLDAQGAAPVVTGANYVVKFTGNALVQGEQEIVVWSTQYEQGGGTVTDTKHDLVNPVLIPLSIPLRAGNDLVISAAYVGTDPGDATITVGLEIV